MPLRARFKKAFGRSSSSSSGTTTPSGFPIEFYKPGEIPRSKYRGAWNQDHQDKLSAFTFSFGRKNSFHGSEYSPAQTRTHSRRSSWSSHHRPGTKGSLTAKNLKAAECAASMIGHVEEIEGDDDVTNGECFLLFLLILHRRIPLDLINSHLPNSSPYTNLITLQSVSPASQPAIALVGMPTSTTQHLTMIPTKRSATMSKRSISHRLLQYHYHRSARSHQMIHHSPKRNYRKL